MAEDKSNFSNKANSSKENEKEKQMTHEEIYEKLVKRMRKYHPSRNFSKVEKAYKLALEAHGDQLRKSGEPYIIHPLSVALILAELELDTETIIAGILHDVIEDTVYSRDEIAELFSEEVALIVDGVTKLEKIEYTTLEEQQADNYRKMFLAMAEDIRVILIKVADRLHNLRTLQFMSPVKQKEKAQETLDIYSPIAHRLGISKIRYELEDLSFRYLNPEAYYEIKDKIQRKQTEREDYVVNIVQQLEKSLRAEKIEAKVEGRPKHFFSIYKKMIGQNKTLDQIYDLFAVRILVDTVADCYGALGVVHQLYHPIQGRFKDYIALPKSNMYMSIHNTLIGPEGEPFEVQIRTWDMHRTSEYGIAAHWKYKSGKGGISKEAKEEAKLTWLRQILEWQRDYSDNLEYLNAIKVDLNIYKDHIYCFTPSGEVITLINGSTPIDFAYAIHSAVGNKMVGSKVSGKIVPIDTPLSTGDRVEILTSQNSKGPSRDWLKIVKSSQARSKISQWFKQEDKEVNIAKGKDMLEKAAKKKGVTLADLTTPAAMKILLDKFRYNNLETICAAVGFGGIKEGQIVNKLYEEYIRELEKDMDKDELAKKLLEKEVISESEIDANASMIKKKKHKNKSGVIVEGVGDIGVRFSKCCSPVPGDEIVGFATRGRGVSVHRTDCVNIINLEELDKHRLFEAYWENSETTERTSDFRADIKVVSDDRIGIISDVSQMFTEEKIPVKAFNARTTKDSLIIEVGIQIRDKSDLERIVTKILNLKGVRNVERITT